MHLRLPLRREREDTIMIHAIQGEGYMTVSSGAIILLVKNIALNSFGPNGTVIKNYNYER